MGNAESKKTVNSQNTLLYPCKYAVISEHAASVAGAGQNDAEESFIAEYPRTEPEHYFDTDI